jgi:hypothetical protein
MSNMAYYFGMAPNEKPLVWLHGEIKTPPFSAESRLEAGFLLRRLQQGEHLLIKGELWMKKRKRNWKRQAGQSVLQKIFWG